MGRVVWDASYMNYAFESITEMMLKGEPIYSCFKVLKINATPFYRYLTEDQRQKIKLIRKNMLKTNKQNTASKPNKDVKTLLKEQMRYLTLGYAGNAVLINFEINKLN